MPLAVPVVPNHIGKYPFIVVDGPEIPPEDVEQFALPSAVIPVANCPLLHCDGVAANEVAVAAFPVVLAPMFPVPLVCNIVEIPLVPKLALTP